jgi:hypothetical protein
MATYCGLSPGCVGVLPFQMTRGTEQHQIVQPVRLSVSTDSVIPERVDMVNVKRTAELFRRDAAVLADAIPLTDKPTNVRPVGAVVTVFTTAAPHGAVRAGLHAGVRQPFAIAARRAEPAARMRRLGLELFAAGLARRRVCLRCFTTDSSGTAIPATELPRPTHMVRKDLPAFRAGGFGVAFRHLSPIAVIRAVSARPRLRRIEGFAASRAVAREPFRRVFGARHQNLFSASTLEFYTNMKGL